VVQKFVPWSRVRIFRNEHTKSTPLVSKLMFHSVSYYFGAFGTIRLGYKTQFKTAKLMEKFMPRSRVGIFCYERNRCTPLDSKLMFWCVLYYLDAIGTVWLPYKTRCKTGRSGAKVRAKKLCQNFSQRTYPIHPIGPLPHVSVHFILFVCIWNSCCVTTLSSKRAKLEQKFVPQSRIWIFRNKSTRSTPLDSKLMFWCVLYYSDAFGTVWLPYKTRGKTGRSGAKVRATKSRLNFSHQTHRIDFIGT
jgi:hypothetical protein